MIEENVVLVTKCGIGYKMWYWLQNIVLITKCDNGYKMNYCDEKTIGAQKYFCITIYSTYLMTSVLMTLDKMLPRRCSWFILRALKQLGKIYLYHREHKTMGRTW